MGRVKLNYEGFRAYRRDPTVKKKLDDTAKELAARATGLATVKGAEYLAEPAIDSEHGSVALVSTGRHTEHSGATVTDNALHDTLRRALGGMGGA